MFNYKIVDAKKAKKRFTHI